MVCVEPGVGGGEGLNKILLAEASPRSPTIFHRKLQKVTFSYTFYWQMLYPFHIPTDNLELCVPFTCCKCAVFKIWVNHKTIMFSWLFLSHKMFLFNACFVTKSLTTTLIFSWYSLNSNPDVSTFYPKYITRVTLAAPLFPVTAILMKVFDGNWKFQGVKTINTPLKLRAFIL